MSGKVSKNTMKDGNTKIGDENVQIYTTKDAKGNNTVFSVYTSSTGNHNFKTQEEAKKFVAKILKE
jgi:hypothetical protein